LSGTVTPPTPEPVELVPAVSVRKSLQLDYLICLEDGKRFKSLKRHLQSKYNLTPAAYREKWGLPSDYPMVAPSYAAARSALAKGMGLGTGNRKGASVPLAKAKSKTRGRPAKAIDPAAETIS